MAEVRLQEVHKRFGEVHAVRGVDLEIAEGEFVVLVGPSGCGKTTLLRMIAGLEEIDDGFIEISGHVVNEVRARDRDIAMVFQNYALYPHLSVFENIAFGLRARRTPSTEITPRVKAAAELLGIDSLLDRYPRHLSGGQRQRVAMGRAIVREPAVFLFDEPLSNLDAQLRDEVRAEIKMLHQRLGTTMVYVTHDQLEAMTLADRIVLLRDGKIEQVGAPIELYEKPATRFVAKFIGSPPVTFVEAQLKRQGNRLSFDLENGLHLPVTSSHNRPLDGRDGQFFLLGIRPEHVHLPGRAPENAACARVNVTVGIRQPTGARVYALLDLGANKTIEAELPVHAKAEQGDKIEVEIDLDRLIIVDPRDDRVI